MYKWNASKYKSSSNLQKNVGQELMNSVEILENDCILDAGCGVGNFTFEIADKARKGNVIGIDSSASMIDKCIEALNVSNRSNVEFINMNLTDIPYLNKFDIIFSNSVLHWVKNIEAALSAFSKALKTNGHIALQFPLLNKSHPLINITESVIEKLELNHYYNNWNFPWYVPDEENFKQILEKMGFNNISILKKKSNFKFNGVIEAYNFFDSVGLRLFLDNLSEEKKTLFIREFTDNLENRCIDNTIELNFERIFTFADKKSL